jgi:CBS domain containing-hemolysin-like protein
LVLEILIVLLLILINGFFVAAEFAIVKVRATKIETLLKDNRRAKIAKEVITHLDAYLSATQLGITIASIALGWVGQPLVARMIEPVIHFMGVTNPGIIEAISFTLGFIIITFFHITLGEQAPKYAAIQYATSTALFVSFPLKVFYAAFKPFIILLNKSANLFLRILGVRPVGELERAHSEEEIRLLIADGRRRGVIDATEFKLIENIFDFTETTVREIMVPRTEVFALDIETPFDENFRLAVESGFTRIPVYREAIDSVIGILYVKDLFKIDRTQTQTDLEKILRPVHFSPETTSVSRLMQDFLLQRIHLGVVIDEFGGMSGIVTLENILEKIVGQIQDEYDDEKKDFEAQPDGSYSVNAKMRIDEFNRQFQASLPEDANYETLAGFLSDYAGHIPNLAENIKYDNLVFKVTKKSPKQILLLRVAKSSGL